MTKKYHQNQKSLFVNDEQSVNFHVKSDDYFGTLATIISLWEQEGIISQTNYQEVYEDLLTLQKKYCIKKRTK